MVDSLGGTRAKKMVCADEGTGLLEETVDPWMETIAQDLAGACLASATTLTEATTSTSANEEKVDNTSISNNNSNRNTSSSNQEKSQASEATTTESPSSEAVLVPVTTPAPETSPTPLYILYGSATGNAEAIAKDLAATYEMILANPDSKTYFPSVVCAELNQFKKMKLAEEIWSQPPAPGNESVKHGVLVVASTTGNGDPPENSDKFLRYLKKSARAAAKDPTLRPFQHVAYAVLALGDTNYDQYCQTGKQFNKFMGELGGTPLRPLACADEGTGQLEEVVNSWTGSILMEVTDACRGTSSTTANATVAVAATAAVTTAVPKPIVVKKERTATPEEEKKDDDVHVLVHQSPVSTSPGVIAVRSLLGDDLFTLVDSLPESTLKSHVTSVEFVSETTEQSSSVSNDNGDDDRSEDDARYTLDEPFESTIAGARYLTATSCDAANETCEMIRNNNNNNKDGGNVAAQKILDRRFPLHVENDVAEAGRNGKRVIELALVLPDDQSWEYQPGDSLGLIVTNNPEEVDFVLNMLESRHGITPGQKVSIDSGVPLTVEEVVREKMDLCTVSKSRKVLFALSQICSDPQERAVLELLSSKTERGSQLVETFVHAQHRSVVDLLREFPSCQSITLQTLVSLLPPIPPRYYSVSSSPLGGKAADCLTVTFSVVDYLTPSLIGSDGTELGLRRIHGLATRQLEALCAPFLSSGSGTPTADSRGLLKIFPKPTEEFCLPDDLAAPLVLIGPGTGIAPFMGFLSHRQALVASGADTATGSVEVFFGCRHSDHDYLYREELEAFDKDGVIDHMNVAFSRDGAKKEYVQDIMTGDADCSKRLAGTILNDDGRVYVCGDGNNMGRDVQAAFAKLLGPHLVSSNESVSSDEAGKAYVEKMKSEGRFLLDIWS